MKKDLDCEEIDRVLDGGLRNIRSSLSERAQSHLAGCHRCSALLDALDDGDLVPVPPLHLEPVQGALLRRLRPVRPLLPPSVYLAAIAFILVAVVAMGGHVLGFLDWQSLTTVQMLATFASLAASACLLAFATVTQMAPGSRYRIPPFVTPLAALLLLLVTVTGVFRHQNNPHFVRVGVPCLSAGLLVAVPSALLLFLVVRRGVMLHPLLSGATCGMLAGVSGTGVLEVHCPVLDVWHVLVWHVGVCLVSALIGLTAAWASSRLRPIS